MTTSPSVFNFNVTKMEKKGRVSSLEPILMPPGTENPSEEHPPLETSTSNNTTTLESISKNNSKK